MRFIPTSFTTLLFLSALAASVVAQPLPMFELTKEWKAKIEAIAPERYRFIQYNDGSEEFYDHSKDPQEWRNVIDQAEYETIIKKHRAQIPQEQHEILGQDSSGHKFYSATEENAKTRRR